MKKLLVLCIAFSFFLISCETGKKEVKVDKQAEAEAVVEEAAVDTAAVDTVAMEEAQ